MDKENTEVRKSRRNTKRIDYRKLELGQGKVEMAKKGQDTITVQIENQKQNDDGVDLIHEEEESMNGSESEIDGEKKTEDSNKTEAEDTGSDRERE